MRSILVAFALLVSATVFSNEEIKPVTDHLRPRQPEWRPKVIEMYPDGSAKAAIFFEDQDNDEALAVKRIHFYPDGKIQEEIDLITIDKNSPVALQWKEEVVPHGLRVYFTPAGKVDKIACYDKGVLHGPYTFYYPEGKVKQTLSFNQGKRVGKAISYYEDGAVLEEGRFVNDEPDGDLISYYPSGVKKCIIPYVKGKIEGKVQKWFEDGQINVEENYVGGLLESLKETPAIVVYDENRAIREVSHFKKGQATGTHFSYHANGQQKSKTSFKDGKMDGLCQIFSETGKLVGEGKYVMGVAVGKHYRKYDNGKMSYFAKYSDKGILEEPISEYNEQGTLTARYEANQENVRTGLFQTWFDNGQRKADFHYVNGQFEGEQKEYFENGQLKHIANYKDLKKEGPFKEWTANGVLIFSATFKNGELEGTLEEWYESGAKKAIKTYVSGKMHGPHQIWYESGALNLNSNYVLGQLDGAYKVCNEEGQIIVDATYQAGKLIGPFKAYYADGKLKEFAEHVDGLKHGKYESYYPDGKQEIAATYANDLLTGEMKGWNRSGALSFARHYDQGRFVGRQEEYFSGDSKKSTQLSKLMQYDENGQLDGEQKTFYENGVLQTLLTYHAGKLHGMKALFNEEGHLLEESFYENDKLEGRFFERDKSGREVIGFFENNRKEGPYEIYYPENEHLGKVKALEATYKKNQLEGDVIEFNERGEKVAISRYVRGKKEGVSILLGPNEKVLVECNFKNDLKDGLCTEYFPSGKVQRTTQFVAGVQTGEERTFFENGKLASLAFVKDGKLHGDMKSWNDKGILVFECQYLDGLRHGIFNKFYDDGAPKLLQRFEKDELHGKKKSYDREGNMTEIAYDHGKRL